MTHKIELEEDIENIVIELCKEYQLEYPSGHWYISQTGLKKIAKVIGFDYKIMGKIRRREFRDDCVLCAMGNTSAVKNFHYYLRS